MDNSDSPNANRPGDDSPTCCPVTQEQLSRMMDEQLRCAPEYLEALSHLEATRVIRERNLDKLSEELETRVAEEFKKDPKVAALVGQIEDARRLAESRGQAPSPDVIAAREKLEKLTKNYAELRVRKTPSIR